MQIASRIVLAFFLIGAIFSAGCAGYRFGSHNLYRSDVQTIAVPVFESDSFRRDLGRQLTEAVVRQIELKTPMKVVPLDRADSVLTGRLTADSKRVVVETRSDFPRDIEMGMNVQIQWRDRRGDMIYESCPIPVPDLAVAIGDNSNQITEAGQSTATTQQAAIEKIAEQIVSELEIPW